MTNADQDDIRRDNDTSVSLADDDLREDVQDALATLEGEEPTEAIQQLLLSPQGRAAFQQMVVTAISVHEERHSGPLPSPRQLREYEATVGGGAERIFQMAEREQQHRHAMQKNDAGFRDTAFAHIQRRERRGQTIGGLLALSVLILSAYMTSLDHSTAAASLAGTTLIGIAAVFVTGHKKKESQPKKETTPPDDEDDDA